MKFCNMLSFIENEQLIDSAVFSEEVGFDSISVSDHIVLPEVIDSWYPDTPDGKPFFTATTDWTFPEPWVTLAMMAQATSRVQLMQSITSWLPAIRSRSQRRLEPCRCSRAIAWHCVARWAG